MNAVASVTAQGALQRAPLDALKALGARVELPAGAALVTEGDRGSAVFVVERGRLLATRRSGDASAALGWVGAGDLVGELGVLSGAPRCASVTAHTAVVAWRVEGSRFVEALQRDPALMLTVTRALAAKARGSAPPRGAEEATLTLYVPLGKPGSRGVVRACRRFLAGLFGGATTHLATGTWRSEADGLVDDELCLVRVFADAAALATHLARVLEHARWVKRTLGEEAVALELDGRLELV